MFNGSNCKPPTINNRGYDPINQHSMVKQQDTLEQIEREWQEMEKPTADRLRIMTANGFVIDTSEWLTISRYSKKHNIPQSTITSWITRGVIPANAVRDLPELNNIRLIKDQLYR